MGGILQKKELANYSIFLYSFSKDMAAKDKVKFIRDFFGYSKPNERSWVRDKNCVNHLTEFFKGKYLHEITPLGIEQYKKFCYPVRIERN